MEEWLRVEVQIQMGNWLKKKLLCNFMGHCYTDLYQEKKIQKQWFRLYIRHKETMRLEGNLVHPLLPPGWFADTPLWILNCLGSLVPFVWGFIEIIFKEQKLPLTWWKYEATRNVM